MTPVLQTLLLFSVLIPARMDFAPSQPMLLTIKTDQAVSLVLSDLNGTITGTVTSNKVTKNQPVNLRELFPTLRTPGVYMLRAIPDGNDITDFIGTPVMVTVQADPRQAGSNRAMIDHIDPLLYAQFQTDDGPMTMAFYYDVAPHTIQNFITLSQRGFYDGLTFHRIIPDYIAQSGDPVGDGTGNPGYTINAEFSMRAHRYGVIAMARIVDPNEKSGAMPRTDFANSGGSQFFIVLNKEGVRQLDGRYTIFGRLVDGLQTLDKIGQTPIADAARGHPQIPPVIRSIEIKPVTAADNPYQKLVELQAHERSSAATLPISVEAATQPSMIK